MSDTTRPLALDPGFDPRSDVFNRLLKNRVIMLGTDVNDDMANQICAQLLYLEGEDANGRLIGRHLSTGIGKPHFWDRARYYNEEKRLAAVLDEMEKQSK